MKIKILFSDINYDDLELNIDEHRNVRHIKFSIDEKLKLNQKFTKEYFHLIHRNIILDDEVIIAFYKIQPNDEVWIGKLEQFLQESDVIVELFSVRLCPAFMYLVISKNESILQLKSKLKDLVSSCANLWDVKGRQLENHQKVLEIDLIEEYYKLLIRFDNEVDRSFIECCRIHDRYIDWEYADKNTWLNLCFPYFSLESARNERIKQIMKFQRVIASNRIIAPRLNENLSRMPSTFVSSQALFCRDVANRIWEICNDNWMLMIGCRENYEHEYALGQIIRDIFFTGLTAALFNYIKCRKSSVKSVEKSMREIVIEAMDRFVKLMNDIPIDPSCLITFAPDFGIGNYPCSGMDELIDTGFNEMYSRLKVKMKESMIMLYCPPNNIETIKQLKEAFSVQTNVPTNYLYLIKHRIGGSDEPNDDDVIEGIWNYHIEIASNMSNIDCLKDLGGGAFGDVKLCLDKSLSKEIVIKFPKNETDIYRDINILSRLYFSSNIMSYYGLYKNEKGISLSMEFMKGKSVKTYLEEVNYISETEVVRISYQILQQLQEIHERNVIHRDIKCDNIMLDDEKNAKLVDFGLSKYTRGMTADELLKNRKVYAPGTIYYIAPEIIKSETYSEKIDIWSFGITLFEMVTGKVPFHDCTPFQAVLKIRNFTTIEIVSPQPISEELKEFIKSCLNLNKNERPSAKELLQSKFIKKYFNEESRVNFSSDNYTENLQLFYNDIFGSPEDNLFHMKFFTNKMRNIHAKEDIINIDPDYSFSECLSNLQDAYFSSDSEEKLKAKEYTRNCCKIFNRHFHLEFDENDSSSSDAMPDSPEFNDSNLSEKLNTFLLMAKDLIKSFKK